MQEIKAESEIKTGSQGEGLKEKFQAVKVSCKRHFFQSLLLLGLSLALITATMGGERGPVKPSSRDKCPVCGMFVAKYPDFLVQIIFKDGSAAFFDGTKDMFKCYLNLKKYFPAKRPSDIDSIYVNDYYALVPVDGYKAFYVMGSDIYGPMGRELIPFEKEADAKEFMKDHKGQSMLRFTEVTVDTLKKLD
jgi:copper chaperone NosL